MQPREEMPSEQFSILLAHAQRTYIQARLISFVSYLSSYGKSPLDFPINLDRNSQFLSLGKMEFFFFSINETIPITQLLGHFSHS